MKRKALVNGSRTINGTKEDAKQKKAAKSPTSPGDVVMKDVALPITNGASATKPGLKDGTVRFMLDPQRALMEKETVAEFFDMEEEQYEIEVPVERPAERERRRP